jgi:hypothetical protein
MSDAFPCPVCAKVFAWGADADSAIVDARGADWRSCRENAHWKLSFHMAAEHPEATMLCPRRGESVWRHGRDFWHMLDHHRVCSYCGSMHPDDFMKAAREKVELGPTDKSYKVYVDLPNPTPNAPKIVSGRNFPPTEEEQNLLPEARKWQRVTRGNIAALRQSGWGSDIRDEDFDEDGNADDWFQMGAEGPKIHAKFYFQHLSVEQRKEFVDLLNGNALNIGVPGYFYSPPFFVARGT